MSHQVIRSIQRGIYGTLITTMYQHSISNPTEFWGKYANQMISWFNPFTKVQGGNFVNGDIAWFQNGKLNVCYNCIDRHLETKKDKFAIIYEGDHPDHVRKITYYELFLETCRLANLLKSLGIRKGDTVAIYMPNTPEAIYAMLACARIGAIHSVIFAGFGFDSIISRVQDANCRVIITADEGIRGGKTIPLKKKIDEVVAHCPSVHKVIVFKNSGGAIDFFPTRDIWAHEVMPDQHPYCPCEVLDSEDPLFILYTSGSTGKPKGLVHTQAGYLLYTTMTHRFVFDIQENDIYACVADVGYVWFPIHILQLTYHYFQYIQMDYWTLIYRIWSTEQWNNYIHFRRYSFAPNTITLLGDGGTPQDYSVLHRTNCHPIFDEVPSKLCRESSLRVLGTVGEPINPEAWRWFHKYVGEERCSIVDTYWQTESGGHLVAPLPGAIPTKAGSCTLPFFGIKLAVIDAHSGKELTNNNVEGVLAIDGPWPGIARTVFRSHSRYISNKLWTETIPRLLLYRRWCKERSRWILLDSRKNVINVAGHRLGTAELESALVGHASVAEAAVIGYPHDIKGQGILAFCTLKQGFDECDDIISALKIEVRKIIGPFATPDVIIISPSLPKTRSGKIMRRILRKIACHESTPDQLVLLLLPPPPLLLILQHIYPNYPE
uniref:acetate--CoA ligase n=1 Tax=Acytostelium leptosomum TaxID=133408 RepID=A0A1L2FUX5_9MYCE|nr:acetyl-CoA synthetase/acetyl-CoA ligase [Acytostelium leptosomum]